MSSRAHLLELRRRQGLRVANASRGGRQRELEVYDWIDSLLEALDERASPPSAASRDSGAPRSSA